MPSFLQMYKRVWHKVYLELKQNDSVDVLKDLVERITPYNKIILE